MVIWKNHPFAGKRMKSVMDWGKSFFSHIIGWKGENFRNIVKRLTAADRSRRHAAACFARSE
jgi:hypothetical protein